MGIDVYLSNLDEQASTASLLLQQQGEAYSNLEVSVQAFLETTDSLQGKAYDSARDYFQTVLLPLAQGGQTLVDLVSQALAKLPSDYREMVDTKSWEEAELIRLKENEEQAVLNLENYSRSLVNAPLPDALLDSLRHIQRQLASAHEDKAQQYGKILGDLRAFDPHSLTLFSDIDMMITALQQGIAHTKTAWNPTTKTFTSLENSDWQNTLSVQQFARSYGVPRPKGMSNEEYIRYLENLQAQVKTLEADGWSKAAIQKGYLSQVNGTDFSQKAVPVETQLAAIYKQARTFGSTLFQQMWNIDLRGADAKKSQKLLRIAMKYVGMPNGLDGTPQQTQALLSRISSKLAPNAPFWATFAKTVQAAYPGDSLSSLDGNQQLKRQIHQFRYVISAFQAQWVRNHFKKGKMTDADALAAYLRSLEKDKMFPNYDQYLNEPARHHNKGYYDVGKRKMVYPGNTSNQANYKVTMRFYTEFILDKDGNFLNEIDPKGATQNGVVNGASFNYADRNGKHHTALDVTPAGQLDPKFRTNEIDNGGKKFDSPDNDSSETGYHSKKGHYATEGDDKNGGKSAADRSNEARDDFRKKLETGR